MDVSSIVVESWQDLRRLPSDLDEVGAQAARIVDHATTWVCRKEGFEPSPVCVLRPLAEAMDLVASAFDATGHEFAERWAMLRSGVVVASAGLADSDYRASAHFGGPR